MTRQRMSERAGWCPLAALPRRDAGADAVLAWRAGAALTCADFRAQVAGWRAALAALPGQRWALFAEDSVDFAAALLGAWHAGKTVIVPGDMQADTLARLRGAADGLPDALARPAPLADAGAWPALDPQATRLQVYTSGTGGEPLAIVKRLEQLDAEVSALEVRFGALCDAGSTRAPTIWATVTHQHIYGLLFRVLWPLAAGRPFVAERLVFNEEIAQRVHGPAVLVSSPAHLRRLPPALDWSAARRGLRAVFSSGGPLPLAAADSTLALLGAAPVEVYGSSETGGIAWRQQARDGQTWQPLPGVALRIVDGELEVRSAHLPDALWWRTADRAAPAPGGADGFELRGRADRIVKIEEKRVSLTALERRLEESPDVLEARVLVLAAPAQSAAAAPGVPRAARPAVVAALSASGHARLARAGKAALVAVLRASLLAAVDRVALPRRWRFVDALPVNAQGKSTEALLAALFDTPPPVCRPQRPAVEWGVVEADHATAALQLAPELLVFDGHFPGHAILPGVAQVDWAIAFARQRFALPPRFRRLDALKFSQPALAGMRLEIEWHWNAASATLQFEYRSAAGRHSSGRVVFGPEAT